MIKNKITLFLMGYKGFFTLKKIIASNLSTHIATLIIARDKSIVQDYYKDIKALCLAHQLPFFDRTDKSFVNETCYSIAISWRWLIKVSPQQKLIVLHDSLLPKYRGFAPLVNQLINAEKTIGVTALFAVSEYDKGDIIDQEKINISYPIKINEAIEKISVLYANMVCRIMAQIKENIILESVQQQEEEASYSLWRDQDDYRINWQKSADYIKRLVDAVGFPYNGACTMMMGKKIIVQEVDIEQDVLIENRDSGKVIFMVDKRPIIVCGTGLLKINKAIFEETKESIFPLKKFRIKFS